MKTAYILYTMKQTSTINDHENQYILSSKAKALWEDPIDSIYKGLKENGFIQVATSYTCNELKKNLTPLKNIDDGDHYNKLKTKHKQAKHELYRKVQIVYYNIVFDKEFRHHVFMTFKSSYADKYYLNLYPDDKARTIQGMMMYPGKICIECKRDLVLSWRSRKTNNVKGSVAIAYSRKSEPKICNSYQKKCVKCDINYYYNRIDYTENCKIIAKQNETLFLDPDAFPYYSISGGWTKHFIHKSIHRSISRHQFCNKSTSIDVWLQHYNDDWKDEYDALKEAMSEMIAESTYAKSTNDSKTNIELEYNTVLRYFYFVCLLRMIRDIEKYKTVVEINGSSVKVALIVTNNDKKAINDDLNFLAKQINTNNGTSGDTLDKEARASCDYLKYFVHKYEEKLLNMDVEALKKVPIKLNDKGNGFIIYPGWFVVYGDGAEKISRIRCASPAIINKLDMLEQMEDEEERKELNDIDIDDNDIDLAIHRNSRMYSSMRYYQCDRTPYRNDTSNNRKSYKCCKYHTAKLIRYGIKQDDVANFITWYQWHYALAQMQNTKVQETIKAVYTIEESALKSIKTKHKAKIDALKAKITTFINDNATKHIEFEKFIDTIFEKINSYRNKDSSRKSPRKTQRFTRAKQSADSQSDNKQELVDKLTDIFGDNDFDDELIEQMSLGARDLLALEINNNKYLDKYKGCRKSKNITGATTARTKGLNGLFNCAGIMIKVTEEIVRETPTAVILEIADAFSNNETAIEYANRIEAIGYDMMCRLYHHLKTLMKNDRLSSIQKTFWGDLIWRAFIDIWHIFTHTDPLCKADGIFHPELEKFMDILHFIEDFMKRINDQVVEQFWSTMNATYQLKAMSREKFLIFLLEKRAYYNKVKLEEIKEEGWIFVPIGWFDKLRSIKTTTKAKFPNEEQLKKVKATKLSKTTITTPSWKEEALKLCKLAAAERSSKEANNSKKGRKRKADEQKDNETTPRKKLRRSPRHSITPTNV